MVIWQPITVAGSGPLQPEPMQRRIFVFSTRQPGAKFDHEGEFIRQWLPELRDVPWKVVHEPWKWAQKAGVTLDYPQPIVEHKEARVQTLAAYEAARKGK